MSHIAGVAVITPELPASQVSEQRTIALLITYVLYSSWCVLVGCGKRPEDHQDRTGWEGTNICGGHVPSGEFGDSMTYNR